MVSAQCPGAEVQIWIRNPEGVESLLLGNNAAALGPSGSSEGVIASTPEKWLYQPLDNKVIRPFSTIRIRLKLLTADGTDYSDSAMVLPFTTATGALKCLGNGDFTGTDLAAASTIGIWHEIAVYNVVEALRFGGGKIFFSPENDS